MICPWITDLQRPRCGCASCDWDSVPDELKLVAIEWATTIVWAATGRQFGTCEMTVRPCGNEPCGDGYLNWVGAWWSGGLWQPYILNGTWYNCACPGMCSCDPRCQVRLDGPVASITEVTIDGVVVDPATYRVDDLQWLVRQGGECWPECPDMNVASGEIGAFEVTYLKGVEVPAPLIYAVGVLACQWIKLCQGGECRLSQRIISMTRNNTDFQFVSPSEMLEHGWTGVNEVDMLIAAYNPYGLKRRLRVFSSANRYPRTTTFQGP